MRPIIFTARLNLTEQQQDQEDNEDQTDNTGWPVAQLRLWPQVGITPSKIRIGMMMMMMMRIVPSDMAAFPPFATG
jgi:hypothetical protein